MAREFPGVVKAKLMLMVIHCLGLLTLLTYTNIELVTLKWLNLGIGTRVRRLHRQQCSWILQMLDLFQVCFKVIQGRWQSCHSIGHIRFPIPLQPLLRSAPFPRYCAAYDRQLNAFIYDATVLEYLASHDDNCRLKTVGKWFAATGYGIGFPKGSRWIQVVNRFMVQFQYDGKPRQVYIGRPNSCRVRFTNYIY